MRTRATAEHRAIATPAGGSANGAQPGACACAGERILLVEDESSVRALASRILRRKGYTVVEAADGDDALRIAREESRPFALLITDLIMPGLDGPQLARMLAADRPGMRVLYMSGYPEDELPAHGSVAAGSFLGKPFLPEDLVASVAAVLATPVAAATEPAA